jgi:hypothetical protein
MSSADVPGVQEIQIEWDPKTGAVTVTPSTVKKGTTIRLKNSKGQRVRIVFLSPDGHEGESVRDSDTYTVTTGGLYHFECFFTASGSGAKEVKSKLGGVIDVTPHRP